MHCEIIKPEIKTFSCETKESIQTDHRTIYIYIVTSHLKKRDMQKTKGQPHIWRKQIRELRS